MKLERSCGVLMHITSLPGSRGTGTLGDEAYRFADFLVKAGQKYWQVLPTVPVLSEQGYSPYYSPSTFAGNHLMISLDAFSGSDWLPDGVIPNVKGGAAPHFAEFSEVEEMLLPALRRIHDAFVSSASEKEKKQFEAFCRDASGWLDDYALYISLSSHFGTYEWMTWDDDIRTRQSAALICWSQKLFPEVAFHKFLQFVFRQQWDALKNYCHSKGIQIIGDIPIYVSFNSAEAWSHPEIFLLDALTEKPSAVAGVPPDYFSATGQRWGNPLYKWFNDDGTLYDPTIQWWVNRLRQINSIVDVIRIDHFRAFEDYWSIPFDEETAINGEWCQGPGKAFFSRIQKELGDLPFIAEDLGIITEDVEKLRDDLGFPGMKILQFAFDGNPENPYLPFNYETANCVVYTGTHDNNTTNGWYYSSGLDESWKNMVRGYLGITTDSDMHKILIRAAYATTAKLAVVPAQDIIGFGGEFRMNTPGVFSGNWRWMITPGSLTDEHASFLRDCAVRFNRIPSDR